MATDWFPDRGVRRMVLLLGTAGLAVLTGGIVGDLLWVIGLGAWMFMIALIVELVYRP
ncbi:MULTISPECIES: hypothetical protein [Streptomyces]|uniref:Uncharacterized protein n=1 Tax=Streptomyces koelreuteriae TaxID=2838015 RepID=A0ABX8FJA6_9ACTN|nr:MULTISPECIES: hypothetical protein [Streptomyces]QWB21159.1 hypothetical protein KJK29_00445 [Streptomyces koelreuteriae]UUA04072.1 hypothetical protein NNW98_00445 [Streptomyces koelreuteriae]UUA11698.1 hypothetical protein NNW99_00445 [Streptomyces sp. CRCS-T-1]